MADAAMHPAVRALDLSAVGRSVARQRPSDGPASASASPHPSPQRLTLHAYQRSAVQWMLDRELMSEAQRLRTQRHALRQAAERVSAGSASAASDDADDCADVDLEPLVSCIEGSPEPRCLQRLASVAEKRYGPLLERLGPGVGLTGGGVLGVDAKAYAGSAAAPATQLPLPRKATRQVRAAAIRQLTGSAADADDVAHETSPALDDATATRRAEILEESSCYQFIGATGEEVSRRTASQIPEYSQPLPWLSDAPITRAARHPLWRKLDDVEADPRSLSSLDALLASDAAVVSALYAKPASPMPADDLPSDAQLGLRASVVSKLRLRPCCAFYVNAATNCIVREPCRNCAATSATDTVSPFVRVSLGRAGNGVATAGESNVATGFDGVARGGMLCDEMGLGKVRRVSATIVDFPAHHFSRHADA